MKIILSHLKATMLLLLVAFACNVWAETTTFSYLQFQGQGTVTKGSTVTAAQGGITISGTNGYGSMSASAKYTTFYPGNVLTITPGSGITITKVVITAAGATVNYNGNAWTASIGSVSRTTQIITWEGSSSDPFTLTNANGTLKMSSLEVTYTKANNNTTAYTVTFDKGSNGSCSTESLTETANNSGVILPACTPSGNYKFLGWSTSENCTAPDAGTTDATYYPSSDCTLHAVYRANKEITSTYTITWNVDGVETDEEVAEGSTITITNPTTVPEGYTFVGWTTTPINGSTSSSQTCVTSATATSDITYYAVLQYTTSTAESWSKVTNTDDVINGTYAIISANTNYYLPNTATDTYPSATPIQKIDNNIAVLDNMKWKVSLNNDNSFTLKSLETTSNIYLYGSSTAQDIKISKTATSPLKNNWILATDSKYGKILCIASTRFISTNNSTDWRNYASNSYTNPANLYKLTTGTIYYCTSTHETITTNANGVVSFVTQSPLDFENVEGFTAYLATKITEKTEENSGSIYLTKATKVPAGTALVATGSASTEYSIPVTADAPANVTNIFIPSDGTYTVTASDYIYALASDGKFKKVAANVTIPAGKAYIKSNTPLAAKTLTLDYDSADVDAISSVKAENVVIIPVKKFIKNGHIVINKGNAEYNAVGSRIK